MAQEGVPAPEHSVSSRETGASPMSCQVVVMGVSATGKTSVGKRLAADLEAVFLEGDDHHPAANVAKMAAGTPLTDEDRAPWLATLAGLLAERARHGEPAVLACSSLRRSYRDVLRAGVPGRRVFFVHLHAAPTVLERRLTGRKGHFMPSSLLRSQLAALEPLGPDELGSEIDVAAPLPEVVDRARRAVREVCDGPPAGR